MKKTASIIREYPLAAALCTAADIAVTAHYTEVSMQSDPTAIVYFIALYGIMMAMLIFSAGWYIAKGKAEKKAADRRRWARKNRINALYSREFYGITENT